MPLRALREGLRSLFRRSVVNRELDEELHHFLEMAIADKVKAGRPRAEAEREARIEIGGMENVKEGVHANGWEAAIDGLWRDARHAVRSLRRNPGFTLVATVGLALGIGFNTAMFSVVNTVILRPLPYRDAERLVMIWTDDAKRGLHREATAHRTVMDWRRDARSFDGLAYYFTERASPAGADPSAPRERTRNGYVSGNLFSVLGVAPRVGRPITETDERDRAPVAVISHSFWQRHFDGAEDVIGKTVTVEDMARGGPAVLTVVGVMPAGFYFPDKLTEIWTPATMYWRFSRETTERFQPWARRWTVVARLSDEGSVASASAELARVGARLATANPSSIADFPGFATAVVPVLDAVTGRALQSALWILLAAVGLVLLVACANVANLLLARSAARQQEFAVRRALGAGRGRLARQLMVESVLLSSVGGAIGLALAAVSTSLLSRIVAPFVPRADELALDMRVLGFATGISVVTGMLFGSMPAWRLSSTDAGEALREGGRGTGTARIRRGRGVLVLAECAMAVVLLAGAGLLLRSLHRVNSVDPGFDPANVLAMRLELPLEPRPAATVPNETAHELARSQKIVEMARRLRALPGVVSVGFTDDLFLGGASNESITIPGRSEASFAAGELSEGAVSPGFLETLRVPLRRGRFLSQADVEQKIRALWSPVITDMPLAEKQRRAIAEPVVVNEVFVRRFFASEDPIGKRFCIDPTNKTYWYEIVGVIGDMHRKGLERDAIPEYFGPYHAMPNGRVDLLVRTSGDPLALAAAVRAEAALAFPRVAIPSVSTAEALLGGFVAQRRFQTWLLTAFAVLAVLIASVGIFGLVHYTVGERTREIGVRVALGASPGDVRRMVVREGMRMPLLGVVVGVLAALAMTRAIAHLLYDVRATDPVTYAGVAGVLLFVALVACIVPARRAAGIDLLRALRRE